MVMQKILSGGLYWFFALISYVLYLYSESLTSLVTLRLSLKSIVAVWESQTGSPVYGSFHIFPIVYQ